MTGPSKRVVPIDAADTSPDLQSAPTDPSSAGQRLHFMARLAEALMASGTASHRLEEGIGRLSRALGLDVHVVSGVTSVTLSVVSIDEPKTLVRRVHASDTNLARLAELYELVGRVERGEMTAAQATEAVDRIERGAVRYRPWMTVLCFGVASLAADQLLGGGAVEVLWSFVLGTLVGLVAAVSARFDALARLLSVSGALLCSVIASVLADLHLEVRPLWLTLAAIVVLLPGLSVTTAITELATGHLVAGTARMMGAATTFLELGFGIAIGQALVGAPAAGAAVTHVLPDWVGWISPAVASLSFCVLLNARRRDTGFIVLMGYLAMGGAHLGKPLLGPTLAGFLGAFAAAVGSNALARLRDRPAVVTLLPSVILLVPGSVGFLSVSTLLDGDTSNAVATAFRMVLVAMSLAAGIMLATLVVTPRRFL